MNAITSYLRHLIVTAVLLAVEKLKLPIEGADAAADVIALTVVGTLSWWFVKYVAPRIKVPKKSGVALFALAASLALLTPSCTGLTTEQNDRILDSAIPVVTDIVIQATK